MKYLLALILSLIALACGSSSNKTETTGSANTSNGKVCSNQYIRDFNETSGKASDIYALTALPTPRSALIKPVGEAVRSCNSFLAKHGTAYCSFVDKITGETLTSELLRSLCEEVRDQQKKLGIGSKTIEVRKPTGPVDNLLLKDLDSSWVSIDFTDNFFSKAGIETDNSLGTICQFQALPGLKLSGNLTPSNVGSIKWDGDYTTIIRFDGNRILYCRKSTGFTTVGQFKRAMQGHARVTVLRN